MSQPQTKSRRQDIRSPIHKPHPDSSGGELDDGEIVFGVFLVSGCDGSVVSDFAKEALDEIAEFIEVAAEGGWPGSLWHGSDIGPDAARGHFGAQGVRVIGPVSQRDIAIGEGVEHIGGAAAIMRLAWRDLQQDRQSTGIDQRMDLGRQPAL